MKTALSKLVFKNTSKNKFCTKLALFTFPQVKTQLSLSQKNFLAIESHLTVA